MKKFEIPEINISLFDAENIITASDTAAAKALEALGGVEGLESGNVSQTTADDWTLTF